jgi:hypothetical protein
MSQNYPPVRPALLTAYRKTRYQVAGIEIRIGQRSGKMDRLLSSRGFQAASLVTAYNPRSRLMPPGWNQRMQQRLRQALRRNSVVPATGSWQRWSEAHVLVFGDTRPVRVLARRYRQNGIVIVKLRQRTQLMITS